MPSLGISPSQSQLLIGAEIIILPCRGLSYKLEPLSSPFLCFFPSSRLCISSQTCPLPPASPYSTSMIPTIKTDWTGPRRGATTKTMHAPLLTLLQAAYAPLPSLWLVRPLQTSTPLTNGPLCSTRISLLITTRVTALAFLSLVRLLVVALKTLCRPPPIRRM